MFVKDDLGLRDTAGCPSRESRETIIDCDRETQQRLLLYHSLRTKVRVIFMHGLLLLTHHHVIERYLCVKDNVDKYFLFPINPSTRDRN